MTFLFSFSPLRTYFLTQSFKEKQCIIVKRKLKADQKTWVLISDFFQYIWSLTSSVVNLFWKKYPPCDTGAKRITSRYCCPRRVQMQKPLSTLQTGSKQKCLRAYCHIHKLEHRLFQRKSHADAGHEITTLEWQIKIFLSSLDRSLGK